MNNGYRLGALALCLGLASLLQSQGASAASCTSTAMVGPKTVTGTLDGTISSSVGNGAGDGCTTMGQGNLENMGTLAAFDDVWTLIAVDVEANDGSNGALVITDTSGDPGDSKTGIWTIDLSQTGIYDTFIVGLKPDGGFAYYNVGDTLSGTYGTDSPGDLSHGLSHANLYGRASGAPPNVPLPGAVWLFGSALLGLAGIKRMR